MELKHLNRKTPWWDITQHYDRIRIWNVHFLNKYKNMEFQQNYSTLGFIIVACNFQTYFYSKLIDYISYCKGIVFHISVLIETMSYDCVIMIRNKYVGTPFEWWKGIIWTKDNKKMLAFVGIPVLNSCPSLFACFFILMYSILSTYSGRFI